MINRKDVFLHNTTSFFRSIFLSIGQVIVPNVIFLFIYLYFNSRDPSKSWIVLAVSVVSVLIFALFTLFLLIKFKLCYIDQLNFLVPLIFTISFILFGTKYSFLWYEFLGGIVLIVIFGFMLSKIIIHLLTTSFNLKINSNEDNHDHETTISDAEKRYLKDYIDFFYCKTENKQLKNDKLNEEVSKKDIKEKFIF